MRHITVKHLYTGTLYRQIIGFIYPCDWRLTLHFSTGIAWLIVAYIAIAVSFSKSRFYVRRHTLIQVCLAQ